MATQAQIDLQTGEPLTDAQVDRVREILQFARGSASDTAMLAAIADLPSEQCQRLKAYVFADWDDIAAEPVRKSGGTSGIDYETTKHQYQVYRRVALLLGLTPVTYAVWIQDFDASGMQVVHIQLGGLYAGSEFGG